MSLIEELKEYGEIRDSGCVLRLDASGYHMREARNLLGPHRHDLAVNTSPERLEAHWQGFVANVNA
jgi:hypothetical protein